MNFYNHTTLIARLGWTLDTDDLRTACSNTLLNEVSMCTNIGRKTFQSIMGIRSSTLGR